MKGEVNREVRREVPSEWEGRLGELAGKRAIRPGASELTFGVERGREWFCC